LRNDRCVLIAASLQDAAAVRRHGSFPLEIELPQIRMLEQPITPHLGYAVKRPVCLRRYEVARKSDVWASFG
jgi:hypothetical protein